MPTLSPAVTAAAPTDFCLFAHLEPRAFWRAISRGEAMVWMLALSLILRLGLAAFMPFTADEAYAVVVSRSHALSYYDHPPLMFALARFMADVTGGEFTLYLRLPFVLMGTASAAFVYDITRRCFSARAGFWASAAFSFSPFFLTFGQLLIVPDGPLDLFLLISFWAMLPVLLEGKTNVLNWIIAGAALALALMSKYQAVLFGVAALIAMASHRNGRRHLLQPGCWLAFGIAALGLIPIVVWNAEHGWISFAFQTGRAYNSTTVSSHLSNLASVLIGQALYVLPGVWFLGQKAIWQTLTKPEIGARYWLAVIAILPIAIFDIIALVGHHSLPHWAMSGFLFTLPLVGEMRARSECVAPKRLSQRFWVSVVTVSTVAALICLQSQTALLTRFAFPHAPEFDMGWQNLDWSSAPLSLPESDSFIVTPDWVQAGQAGLAFGNTHPIEILSDPHQFQFMDQGRLKQLSKGYLVFASALGHHQSDTKALLTAIKGHYQLTGQPIVQTQTRMGFPSFNIVMIPIRRF